MWRGCRAGPERHCACPVPAPYLSLGTLGRRGSQAAPETRGWAPRPSHSGHPRGTLTSRPAANPPAQPRCLRGALVLGVLAQQLLQLLKQLRDRRHTARLSDITGDKYVRTACLLFPRCSPVTSILTSGFTGAVRALVPCPWAKSYSASGTQCTWLLQPAVLTQPPPAPLSLGPCVS